MSSSSSPSSSTIPSPPSTTITTTLAQIPPPPASTSPSSSERKYNYPFATSPDIIRSHQKDAYTTTHLCLQVTSILRSLLGARFAHTHATTTQHLSELLYLCVTTLLGNRTLGEEYCDVIQVNDDTRELASLIRRAGYIVSVVFAPWMLGRSLPALRRRLRAKLERNVERARHKAEVAGAGSKSVGIKAQEYILKHLDALTSLSPFYALSLAAFYFTGSYYHLSKRLFGLRYIFTKRIQPDERRVGYEVLGVLLVLQMAVQSALHVRETYLEAYEDEGGMRGDAIAEKGLPATAMVGPGVEMAMSSGFDDSGQSLLADIHIPHHLSKGLAQNTQTPILEDPRYDAKDDEVMAWIPEGQQRKCTLCLEPFRDPSATTCGHVFCWTCVQDWVKEKAECPLCRQAVLPQKILPLR